MIDTFLCEIVRLIIERALVMIPEGFLTISDALLFEM